MPRKNQRERRHDLRQRLVEMRGSRCAVCNQKFETHQFDFHHVMPETKSFPLTKTMMTSRSWQSVLEEANKCIMVCANCHRDIHEKEQTNEGSHS